MEAKNDIVEGNDEDDEPIMEKPSHTQGFNDEDISKSKEEHVDSIVDESNSTQVIIETQESTSSKLSNGFVHEESTLSKNNPTDNEKSININHSSTNQVSKPPISLLYRFCPKCMSNLQNVMRTIIISLWEEKKKSSKLTTEDVHDTVTSLSLNLYKNIKTFFEGREVGSCECEVGCHLDTSGDDLDLGCGLELIYRKGVVVGELEKSDECFDCKFERVCLCSVIEYIVEVRTKQ